MRYTHVLFLLATWALEMFIIACEPMFKLNPTGACSGGALELLVWIHSAPKNVRKRNAIRMTWGNTRDYAKQYPTKAIFFLGLPTTGAKDNDTGPIIRDTELQSKLEYEQERYGDIVQGEFMDTYKNMTHKAVHSLRWISKFCSKVKFIMKVDDDIIVNTFKLLPYLRLKQYKKFYPESIISCNLWRNAKPNRDKDNKWYVSKGMVYFITPDLVPRLYNESLKVPYIFMDDVYITGLLATRLKDPPVLFRKLSTEYAHVYGVGRKVVSYVNQNKKKVTFVHTDTLDSFYECWTIIKASQQDFSINKFVKPYLMGSTQQQKIGAVKP